MASASPVRWRALAIAALAVLAGATGAGGAAAERGGTVPTWKPQVPLDAAIDIAGPRSDGRFVVTAAGQLSTFDPAMNALQPFARGANGYATGLGEPYIAVSPPGLQGPGGCSYGRDAVYAVETGANPRVIKISRHGRARPFFRFDTGFPSGIVFDSRGSFGHRLLVVVQAAQNQPARLFAFDCDGRAEVVVEDGPRIEGGIAIAPRSFGVFGGTVIAPDEHSGTLYALGADGGVRVVLDGLLAGLDFGVESTGFVPKLSPGARALLADPNSGVIQRLRRQQLRQSGVRRGDLLVAAEGGGLATVAVRCDPTCVAREAARTPDPGHAEGHIVFFRP